jgi:hypothetical protein
MDRVRLLEVVAEDDLGHLAHVQAFEVEAGLLRAGGRRGVGVRGFTNVPLPAKILGSGGGSVEGASLATAGGGATVAAGTGGSSTLRIDGGRIEQEVAMNAAATAATMGCWGKRTAIRRLTG